MRNALGLLLVILSIPTTLYIALWWGIVEPIMTIADAIDNDTVTATLVGWEIIKFLCREIIAGAAFYLMFIGGASMMRK